MKDHNGLFFCNSVQDMTDTTYAYNAGQNDRHQLYDHRQCQPELSLVLRHREGAERGAVCKV